jgi:signal peptidase I
MKNFLREFLFEIIFVALFIIVWFTTIQAVEIFQTSMEPNFHEGERVIIFKAAYWSWIGHPQRGDIVVIKAPQASEGDFIKRVIGLPGDSVEVVHGALYINGIKMNEPYVKRSFTYSLARTVVPAGEYFVLGDNRDISNDSHLFGPLPAKNIIGKVFVVYWPPHDWQWVRNYPLVKQLASLTLQAAAGG